MVGCGGGLREEGSCALLVQHPEHCLADAFRLKERYEVAAVIDAFACGGGDIGMKGIHIQLAMLRCNHMNRCINRLETQRPLVGTDLPNQANGDIGRLTYHSLND